MKVIPMQWCRIKKINGRYSAHDNVFHVIKECYDWADAFNELEPSDIIANFGTIDELNSERKYDPDWHCIIKRNERTTKYIYNPSF